MSPFKNENLTILSEFVSKKASTGAKIVTIDDDNDLLGMINSFLGKNSKIENVSFTNEYEALTYMSYNKVDLVVIDVNLSHYKAFEYVRLLRLGMHVDVPILFISVDPNSVDDFYKYDMDNAYFLPKPFGKKTFLSTLSDVLNTSPLAKAG
ncbi:MAG: response regulator [Halobacteriovoraceae bacterium]|nr:response regulator [Halobacteriovoraceae bacterium]